jgi:hypothetical protein
MGGVEMAKKIENVKDALYWTVKNLLDEAYRDTGHLNETARKFTMQYLVINILERHYKRVIVSDADYDTLAKETGIKGKSGKPITGKTLKTWLAAGTNITDEHLIGLAEFTKRKGYG